MQLYERLGVPCGVTAVIGSGGKTTLLRTLSRELPGTVILTTTTHILPFEGVPLLTAPTENEVRAALARSRVFCLGTPAPEGKLTAPSLPFSLLEQLAASRSPSSSAASLPARCRFTRWPSSACRRPTARSVWWTTTQRSRRRRTQA